MVKRLVAALGVTFALACGASFVAPTAHAAARFEASDAGYVKAGETVDGSAYMAGNTERIEGVVNGDVFCAGNDLVINGTVDGDVVCAGNTITINGKVNGDVRVAGNSVTIGAEISGSLSAFGNTVTLESAAKVTKDATIAGNNVLVNGSVGRDIVGGGSGVILNGAVGRNIEGEYENLTIGKDATVAGYLHYASKDDATVTGKVNGGVERSEPRVYTGQRARLMPLGLLTGAVIGILWVIVTALGLALILPKKMATVTNLSWRGAALATLIGFCALFGVPTLALFAMISIVAAPLGFALLFVWLAILAVSMGVTAIYIGRVVARRQKMHPVVASLVGAVILGVLLIIPVLDLFVILAAVSFGLGAVLYAIRGEYEGGLPAPRVKLAKGN